jgi:hypothetical protein
VHLAERRKTNMCKERIKTRIFAILLVFCMLASSMPLLAYAADGTEADKAQQVTEEKQEGTETQPSQEPAPNAEKTVTEIAEKAVSEAAEDPGAEQAEGNAGSTGKSAAPTLRAAANDAVDPAEEDDGTGVETDEQTDLPEGGQEVKFVFDGADKLEAWIEGVSESSFSRAICITGDSKSGMKEVTLRNALPKSRHAGTKET